jgi:apolipoprotein N-acyltransferase
MRPGFKRFIQKHGANPSRSWRIFLYGLLTFGFGLGCILVEHGVDWLYSAGLAPLFAGFFLAMYGYVGIFASRFNRLL